MGGTIAYDLADLAEGFFRLVTSGEIEIYNEFSLQHEFGIYLRHAIPRIYKVQFERSIDFFGHYARTYLKKEIDISIFTPDFREKTAIELKFPRNGQYPEQMFKWCEDISFLEQVVIGGFDSAQFLVAADDPLFYERGGKGGIYSYFRSRQPLHGPSRRVTRVAR